MKFLQISENSRVILLGPSVIILWGNMSLFPRVGILNTNFRNHKSLEDTTWSKFCSGGGKIKAYIGTTKSFVGSSSPRLSGFPKTSIIPSVIRRFSMKIWLSLRGILTSLSCLAESPVQMTKSTSYISLVSLLLFAQMSGFRRAEKLTSLRFSLIQAKVSFTKLNGVSQPVAPAPKTPASPLPRWQRSLGSEPVR